MKFDYILGNPPYQDDTIGDNKGFAPPLYHYMLDGAYELSDHVIMIHPARFLYNAGSTPKAWNQKMLSDPHLKVIWHEQDGSKVFPGTDIKGGVVVTYHDANKEYGPIGIYTPYDELNGIIGKAAPKNDELSLADIIYTQCRFDLEALYADHPELRSVIGSDGKDKRFRNNIFDKISLFTETKSFDDDIQVYGVIKNKRVWRYLPRKYISFDHENMSKWKVLVPRVNGSGEFGIVLSSPVVAAPMIAYTQTFIGIGSFDTKDEAEASLQYIKTKFARCMLCVLKITQDNDREAWRMIPLQNFTPVSDIDWSASIAEIDAALYRKYGLDGREIEFIETHVKEMS